MIDRAARQSVASLTRRLACGGLTNDQFQDELFAIVDSTEDKGLMLIAEYLDSLYGDLWTYRLRGKHKLSRETRHWVARCILWLRSDERVVAQGPEEQVRGPCHLWDLPIGLAILVTSLIAMASLGIAGAALSALLTAAWLGWIHRRQIRHQRQVDSVWRAASHWPFPDEAAFRQAKRVPFFLTGGSDVRPGSSASP